MSAGQNSLNNFYQSVMFSYPQVAALMSEDIMSVALNAMAADKSPGQAAADSLREKAENLPEAHRRVLENALQNLGYS